MSDERTRRTMIGTGAVLVMSVSQLVHVCYELHSLSKDHSTWVGDEKYYLIENYLTLGVPHRHARVDTECLPRVSLHCHDVTNSISLDFCGETTFLWIVQHGS